MRRRRDRWSRAIGSAAVALAVLAAGVVPAQDPPNPAAKAPAPSKDKDGKASKNSPKKGGLRTPGREPVKGVRKAVDPLANPPAAAGAADAVNKDAPKEKEAAGPLPPPGTFHYRFKVVVGNAEPLAMTYYPSKLGNSAPVVMLVHERERSGKDFEEPIAELRGLGLAEHLQKQGFATLIVDLRGHGANPRRNVPKSEWAAIPNDLQAAYYCLVDRHNWGELNLAKLGVVALGEGANAAATWASGGGGVSSEGRAGDIGAMVMLSPMVDDQSQGLKARPAIAAIAARIPIDLMVGERDTASFELVDDRVPEKSIRGLIKRYRTNQVETFPSKLHGYQMVRLEPNLTASITRFLEGTVKGRADEWEGRYLLNPVGYTDIKVIPNPVRIDPATKKAIP